MLYGVCSEGEVGGNLTASSPGNLTGIESKGNALHLWAGRMVSHVGAGVQGYALMCVGFPLTDVELETQDEDEVR